MEHQDGVEFVVRLGGNSLYPNPNPLAIMCVLTILAFWILISLCLCVLVYFGFEFSERIIPEVHQNTDEEADLIIYRVKLTNRNETLDVV